MAWKKPFFKRVSSKISARMLTLMTLGVGVRAYKVRFLFPLHILLRCISVEFCIINS
jgi:hypothetical protein